jgi:hypothetical protein
MFAKPDALVTLSKAHQQIIPKPNCHDSFIKANLLLESSVVRTRSVRIYVFHVLLRISSLKVTSEYMSSAFSVI